MPRWSTGPSLCPFCLLAVFPSQQMPCIGWESGPMCRSLLLRSPRQHQCQSVFIRDHRALCSHIWVPHSLPDLFDSPGCHPIRQRDVNMKHMLPPPFSPQRQQGQNWPKGPDGVENGSLARPSVGIKTCQGWCGRRVLGTVLDSGFGILRFYFLIKRKPFLRKTFDFFYHD